MRRTSWLAAKPVSFSRRTLLHAVSNNNKFYVSPRDVTANPTLCYVLIGWIEWNSKWVRALSVPMYGGVFDRRFVPHNLLSKSWECCSFTKVQDCPTRRLLTSSGSKRKEPKLVCLSEAKASHSHKTWAGVTSYAPRLLHKGLSISPIT